MKTKKLIWIILIWLTVPCLTSAVSITMGNQAATAGNLNDFFKAILGGILNIIAFLGVLFIVIGGIIYVIASNAGDSNMVETAKRILVGSLIGIGLGLAGPTFIKEIQGIILGSGGAAPTSNLGAAPSLTEIVERTLSFLLSIIGVLAIISLVINSIRYLTALGNPSGAEEAKKNIRLAIMGLVIAGAALIIVKQIILFVSTTFVI